MTIKELFKKVEQINKNQKELGLSDEELNVYVQFDYYNKETFSTYNKLCDYLVEEYVEEYVDEFLNVDFIKEENHNSFIAQFISCGVQSSILVVIEKVGA